MAKQRPKKKQNFSLKIESRQVAPSPHLINLHKEPIGEGEVNHPRPDIEAKIHAVQEACRERVTQFFENMPLYMEEHIRNVGEWFKEVKKRHISQEFFVPHHEPAPPRVVENKKKRARFLALPSLLRRTPFEYCRAWKMKSATIFLLIISFFLSPIVAMMIRGKIVHAKSVLYKEAEGIAQLIDATKKDVLEGDFQSAALSAKKLEEAFRQSRKTLDGLGMIVRIYPQTRHLYSALASGGELANSGAAIFEAFGSSSRDRKNLGRIESQLNRINDVLLFLEQAPPLEKYTRTFKKEANFWIKIAYVLGKLAGNPEGRYLLIFQNEGELRPTGGFMGSFALLTFGSQGFALDISPQGSYALQGWLTRRVLSPEPLQLINARFEFQDANWFPDFPVSAKKIIEFYEASGGTTVDGVIALNSSFLEDLLRITGPITLPDQSVTISAETATNEIETRIQKDRQSAAPKQFLVDLSRDLTSKLIDGRLNGLEGLSLMVRGFQEKKIQLFLRDKQLEKIIKELGWAGEITDRQGDFLMLVGANIAGGKTDRVIEQKVYHESNINEQGEIISRVQIKRLHHGNKGDTLTGVRNVNFIRLYVPRGSTLLSVEGFSPSPDWLFEKKDPDLIPDPDVRRIEVSTKQDMATGTFISEESGKTVFGKWSLIDPGEEKTMSFTFKLPFTLVRGQPFLYTLAIEKQAGRNDEWKSVINIPGGYVKKAVGASSPDKQSLVFDGRLDTDISIAALIER